MQAYKAYVPVSALAMTLLATYPGFAQQAESETYSPELQEIIVTAQKTAHSLSKTAAAISAVSGENLAESGIANANSIGSTVTGVAVATQGTASNLSVRGVGSSQFSPLGGSAVGFVQDGVAIEGNIGLTSGFYDLERVEVMKGPQGTLYGLNATGGVIAVVSAKPQLGETSGALDGEYGNYNGASISGNINVPLNQHMAARVSGTFNSHDPYVSNTYNDAKQGGVRGQLLMEQDAWSLLLGADYYHEGGVGDTQVPLPLSSGRGTSGGNPFNVNYFPTTGTDAHRDDTYWGVRAELNADLGFANLTVLPAYRVIDTDDIQYINSFRADVINKSSQTSVEARLTGDIGPVKWLLGGYGFWGEREYNGFFYSTGYTPVGASPLQNSFLEGDSISANAVYSQTPKESQAAFGQLTWSVRDDLRLVGGLRYSHDTREVSPNISYVLKTTLPYVPSVLSSFVPISQLHGIAISPGSSFSLNSLLANDPANLYIDTASVTRSAEFSHVDFKAGVEYDLTDRTLAYANVTSGYKAGGVNAYAFGNGSLTYKPEKLTSYEVGVRSRLGSVRLHLNGFYWSYKDHQEGAIYNIPGVGTQLVIENIPSGSLYGADLDLGWQVTENDNLSLAVSRLESDTGPFSIGSFTETKGHEYVNAPHWTINGSYEHVFPLGDYEFVARGEGHYQSDSNLEIRFSQETLQKAYFTANVMFTFRPVSNNWYVTAFSRNITDETYLVGAIKAPGLKADYWGNLGAPRTYGIRGGIKF
ncbi:TonB-dependent receptor [Nitrospirillum viridazoti]|uniref:Iron complex outermembrane receptor protein n=1 Tax=Nitrospirillum amazonense TaxID=28077 RepID=A0A560IRE4_9PROT|nr:TonB-dependent receptor [Nitrospirillum amazonense]TWB60669.1 iron complex outermembrane receptor protein [Nitrospirillum amazonense]